MDNLNEILTQRQEIIKKYVSYFSSLGYAPDLPVGLVTNDPSVLFTNATIIAWKKYLLSEKIPSGGVFTFLPQPCLRLRVFNDVISSSVINEKTSSRCLGYFSMLGLLCEGKKSESLSKDVAELLLQGYSLPRQNIKIFVANSNEFAEDIGKEFSVVRGTEPESEYKWQYGRGQEVFGEGIKIRLLQKDGEFTSVGQIIRINSLTKITYEFGFGVETFLSRSKQDSSYNSWTIAHCVPEEYRFKTLLDLFSCLGAGITLQRNTLSRRKRKEIRRISRRISQLERALDIPEKIAEEAIVKFINIEFNRDMKEETINELVGARKSLQQYEQVT